MMTNDTETDGPFVEAAGRTVRPSAVAQTVADVATLRGETAEVMAHWIVAILRAVVKPLD